MLSQSWKGSGPQCTLVESHVLHVCGCGHAAGFQHLTDLRCDIGQATRSDPPSYRLHVRTRGPRASGEGRQPTL